MKAKQIVLVLLFLGASFLVGDLMWKLIDPIAHSAYWKPLHYPFQNAVFVFICGLPLFAFPGSLVWFVNQYKKMKHMPVNWDEEKFGNAAVVALALWILLYAAVFILFR